MITNRKEYSQLLHKRILTFLKFIGIGFRRVWLRNEDAVSEILGIILVLLISSSAIGVILLTGIPYMSEKKATVALESSLFQLDVIENLIDESLNDGAFKSSIGSTIGSSESANLKLHNGELSLNKDAGRFIYFYSVYETNNKKDIFGFDVTNFDTCSFDIKVINVNSSHKTGQLKLNIKNLGDGKEIELPPVDISNLLQNYMKIYWDCNDTNPKLEDAVKITISYIPKSAQGPGQTIDYGYIWLFDVGSITYKTETQTGIYRAIMQDTGIYSAHNQFFIGYYNEPKSWSQSILNNKDTLSVRIMQIKNDPASQFYSIANKDAFNVKISVNQKPGLLLENKKQICGNIKVKIYGDNATVDAWHYYYTNKLGFVYNENYDLLELRFVDAYLKGKHLLFSLYQTVCNINMEVVS